MKHLLKFSPIVLLLLILFISCNLLTDIQDSASNLTFKASNSSKTNLKDTVLFSEKDIKSLNDSTGEIIFTDSLIPRKLNSYHWIKCFMGTDSLFTATLTSDIMSSIVNDLVLNHNLRDGKYYFENGYPADLNNIEINTIRLLNNQNRAEVWNRFIEKLRKDRKVLN